MQTTQTTRQIMQTAQAAQAAKAKRRSFLRRLALFFLLALLLLAAHGARAQSMDYVVTRDTPDWFKASFLDFHDDVEEAAAEGKRVMIYFGQDGCPYCKKLHDLNYRQADIVSKMRAHLDSIAVNIYGDAETVWTDGEAYTEKSLAAKLGIQFTPTLLFLDEDGREILRLAGYQPPKKFVAALAYVINKQEQTPFAEYLRAALAAEAGGGDDGGGAVSLAAAFARPPYSFGGEGGAAAVFVTQRECAACDEWREFLLSPQAEKWRAARRVIEMDLYGKQPTHAGGMSDAEWTAARQVAFVPALIFIDADGKEEFRVDGYLRAFHLDSVWDYVTSGAYRREPEFQRFLQARADHLREQGVEVKLW